jgi:hypothetical protein
MKITLPKSKYVLELKDFISNRVFREYQKILITDTDIIGGKDLEVKIGMDKVYKAQDYVLEQMIVGLEDEAGNKMEKPFDAIMELSVEDGNVVYEKIQEFINGSSMSESVKKNG